MFLRKYLGLFHIFLCTFRSVVLKHISHLAINLLSYKHEASGCLILQNKVNGPVPLPSVGAKIVCMCWRDWKFPSVPNQLFAQGRPQNHPAEGVGGLRSTIEIKKVFVSSIGEKFCTSALLPPVTPWDLVVAFKDAWAVPFRLLMCGLTQRLLVAGAYLGKT